MIHKLGGLAAGLITAFLTMMLVEALGNRLHGSGLEADASASLPVAQQPVTLLLFVLAGWFLGAFLGGSVAVRVSRVGWMAWPIAGAILIGVALMFTQAPHPSWMFVAGPAAPLLGAWLAQRIVERRLVVRAKVSEDRPAAG